MERICSLIQRKIGGVLNYTNIKNTKKVNLLVLRFRKNGNIDNARPCHNCLKMMKDVGINKVYYSSGCDNGIICENVKNMVSIQSSSVTRRFSIIKNSIYNDRNIYYEDLIKSYFPSKIKKSNLNYFIEYNFKNVLPEHNFKINNDIIIFYNKNNEILLRANII